MALALLAGGRAASAESRELFIGNSLTLTNNLPALVGQIRAVSGQPMDYSQRMAAELGVGLDWHWADTSAQSAHALLAAGQFDGVVLQDLSFNPTDTPNLTRTYARLWDQEIKTQSPHAQTYLYAPWERQDRPNSQGIIDDVYSSIGVELDATMVPVGRAWKRLESVRPDIELYTDVVHPTLRGSYQAAATFYASIYGQSPIGFAPPPGINAVDAAAIQNVAWDVVSGRLTAVDRSWTGASGDWNDPAKWSGGALPAVGDRISITSSDGIDRVINYANAGGASTLLGSMNIAASSGSITVNHSQQTLRVAGNLVLGDSGASGNYQLGGSGRIFAARDEQIINGSFAQHGGKHVVMQKLIVGGDSSTNASFLIDGGLLAAGEIDVKAGGVFTQTGGTLDAGQFHLDGGKVQGTLRNRGIFNYSSGVFQGKLINEGTATLAFNTAKVAATETGALPQLDIEVSGEGSSLVSATANQDLKSLVVHFANEGTQGFDLASGGPNGQYRAIRIFPGDAGAIAAAQSALGAAIANALSNPGDGIYDSGLDGRPGTRIGLSRRSDVSQNEFLLMRPTVIGDLNLDGAVSISDFIDLAANFNQSGANWDQGDLNYDGSVSIADFIDLAANFGRTYSGEIIPISVDDENRLNSIAASVPEPASMALMLALAAYIASKRKRG